jgi:phosphonate transport system ATP-binding protein
LDDISLTIAKGEMVALIGASGSGKSTLIRHIAGLVAADKAQGGTIKVHDRAVQDCGRIAADVRNIRREIGVIFQQFNLVGRMSVLTNVLAGVLGKIPVWRGTLGAFPLSEQQAAMTALMRVGIAETARQRASTLSGGQQQRAAIARALVQGARILLADEPIASLDPASARKVMETLENVNQQDGITVVVALHQVEYARRFCLRTIAMEAGRVVFDGPSAELSNERLRQIYGSASEELILPDAGEIRRPAPSLEGFAAAAAA